MEDGSGFFFQFAAILDVFQKYDIQEVKGSMYLDVTLHILFQYQTQSLIGWLVSHPCRAQLEMTLYMPATL